VWKRQQRQLRKQRQRQQLTATANGGDDSHDSNDRNDNDKRLGRMGPLRTLRVRLPIRPLHTANGSNDSHESNGSDDPPSPPSGAMEDKQLRKTANGWAGLRPCRPWRRGLRAAPPDGNGERDRRAGCPPYAYEGAANGVGRPAVAKAVAGKLGSLPHTTA